ncbi:MAG: hypothetical protein IPQ07_40035 [Myxococcales bacterium]|nr:hypothetical protein [Myxococcales bacterium]
MKTARIEAELAEHSNNLRHRLAGRSLAELVLEVAVREHSAAGNVARVAEAERVAEKIKRNRRAQH